MTTYDTKRSTRSRHAIETQRLCKKYGATYALKDLSLHVNPGEIVGYLGPNGAGKTTTLRLLTGLAMPSDGKAFIAGRDCRSSDARGRLGVIPNDASPCPPLTGGQVLELLAHLHDAVDRHYRSEVIKKFGPDLTIKCGAYSTGNRQKLLIIAALTNARPS